MNESQQKFRDRLLGSEKSLPTEAYRKAMAELMERKLNPAQRTFVAVVGIATVGAAILMGWLAIHPPNHLPLLARLGLGLGAIGSLVLALLAALVAKRGVMRRNIDPARMINILFLALVAAATIMLVLAGQVPDATKRIEIVLNAFLMFGMGGFFVVLTRAEQIELRTQEKLLEIEFQMQQIAEEVRKSAASKR